MFWHGFINELEKLAKEKMFHQLSWPHYWRKPEYKKGGGRPGGKGIFSLHNLPGPGLRSAVRKDPELSKQLYGTRRSWK